MKNASTEFPLVSIILPTYNRGEFIAETIESVISQTYQKWELLIIDDGSQDNTAEIVARYAMDKIHYIKRPHTGYIGKTRNVGLRRAKGELVAFHDSDDLWRADKLALQISLLKDHPGTFFVISNGDKFGDGAIPTPDYESLLVGNILTPVLIEQRLCFYSPTLLFKKEVIKKIGYIDENVQTTRDILFFYRMSAEFKGIFTNERLVRIRKHVQNTSSRYNVMAYINSLEILEEFLAKKIISKKNFKRLSSICYYKMGLLLISKQEPQKAFHSFFLHNQIRPLYYKGWARILQSLFLILFRPFTKVKLL